MQKAKTWALGCQGCSTSWHDSDAPLPSTPAVGRFLSKVPPRPSFAVNTAESEIYQPGGNSSPSSLGRFITVFRRVSASCLAICREQESQSLSSKRQQARGTLGKVAHSQPPFICPQEAWPRLGLFRMNTCANSLPRFTSPCFSCVLESFFSIPFSCPALRFLTPPIATLRVILWQNGEAF